MKHLRHFESVDINQNEQYFQDKIDWKLFRRLEYATTTYADKGKFLVITINTKSRYYSDIVYISYMNLPTDHDTGIGIYPNNRYAPNSTFNSNKTKFNFNGRLEYKIEIPDASKDEIKYIMSKLTEYKPSLGDHVIKIETTSLD